MDNLDRLIIGELAAECRVSFSKLAEKYDVSLNTIKNRVEALVEDGVIHRFVVQLPLDRLQASFAVLLLEIESDTSKEDIASLGMHPFIMAMGLGYELRGFAVGVYRTNIELSQAVDHLQASDVVKGVQALPMVAPPTTVDTSSSKGLDALKKIDWRIIKSLQFDGRKTLSDVSSDVGASVPTVRKRLKFMRKHNLVSETIEINPAASEDDLIVMLRLESPAIIKKEAFELDMLFREQWPNEYWLSYRLANRPELMVTFVVDSSKRVAALRNELTKLLGESEIAEQVIVPEWIFFPDFRNEMVDKHSSPIAKADT
jgi:DNA-binding Lrp family transcriptional regulator